MLIWSRDGRNCSVNVFYLSHLALPTPHTHTVPKELFF